MSSFVAFDGSQRFLALTGAGSGGGGGGGGTGTVHEGYWDGSGLAICWGETRGVPRPRGEASRQAATVQGLVVVYGGGNGIEAFAATPSAAAAEARGQGATTTATGGFGGGGTALPPLGALPSAPAARLLVSEGGPGSGDKARRARRARKGGAASASAKDKAGLALQAELNRFQARTCGIGVVGRPRGSQEQPDALAERSPPAAGRGRTGGGGGGAKGANEWSARLLEGPRMAGAAGTGAGYGGETVALPAFSTSSSSSSSSSPAPVPPLPVLAPPLSLVESAAAGLGQHLLLFGGRGLSLDEQAGGGFGAGHEAGPGSDAGAAEVEVAVGSDWHALDVAGNTWQRLAAVQPSDAPSAAAAAAAAAEQKDQNQGQSGGYGGEGGQSGQGGSPSQARETAQARWRRAAGAVKPPKPVARRGHALVSVTAEWRNDDGGGGGDLGSVVHQAAAAAAAAAGAADPGGLVRARASPSSSAAGAAASHPLLAAAQASVHFDIEQEAEHRAGAALGPEAEESAGPEQGGGGGAAHRSSGETGVGGTRTRRTRVFVFGGTAEGRLHRPERELKRLGAKRGLLLEALLPTFAARVEEAAPGTLPGRGSSGGGAVPGATSVASLSGGPKSGGGGGGLEDEGEEPSLEDLWATRDLEEWEKKPDNDLIFRQNDGTCVPIVVDDLGKLMEVIGSENFF